MLRPRSSTPAIRSDWPLGVWSLMLEQGVQSHCPDARRGIYFKERRYMRKQSGFEYLGEHVKGKEDTTGFPVAALRKSHVEQVVI